MIERGGVFARDAGTLVSARITSVHRLPPC